MAGSYFDTSGTFRLAATVAAYAEVLRESIWAENVAWSDLIAESQSLLDAEIGDDPDVVEFVDLVERAARLGA